MKNEELFQAVLEAVSETLESMVFEEVTPSENDASSPLDENSIWASLDIKSPEKGKFAIQMPAELAFELAEQLFMGDESFEMTEAVAVDTLAELVNTVAGKFMSDNIQPDQSLEVGLPQTGRNAPEGEFDNVFRFTISDSDFKILIKGISFVS